MAVQVGSPAPKFKTLAYDRTKDGTDDQFRTISLDDYKGKWLFLYFYPKDFTFVCPTEIKTFDDNMGEQGLKHPLLADMNKRVSMDYGVLLPEEGVSLRGSFLIDPDGIVRWANINDLPVGRNVDEVLRVLDALQTDELCPCNWKKGEATLQAG